MSKRIFALFLALQLLTATAMAGGSQPATPGGTNGQLQYNSAGSLAGFTLGGDCSINVGTGALTCTKTGGVSFAPSATTDTTNAGNIATGTMSAARLPTATTGALGGVKIDGTSITINGSGVISTVGGSGTVTSVSAGSGMSVGSGCGTGSITVTGTLTPCLSVTAKTGSYTLLSGDNNSLLTFTGSSPSTFTLTSAATLGNTWCSNVANKGSANLTLSSTSTIASSIPATIAPKGWANFCSNGTSFDGQGNAGALTGVTSIGSNLTLVGGVLDATGGAGGGVTTLNSLSGALSIAAGSNVTVTPSGSTITISASSSASTNFGSSTSAASPQISGDATSGLYTSGAGKVDLAIGGSNLIDWSSAGQAIASSSTTALAVGLNGATNPVFAVDASTALQASGLFIKGGATGSSVTMQVTDSGSNAGLAIKTKGTGGLAFNQSIQGPINLYGSQISFAPIAFTGSPVTHFSFIAPSDSGITGGSNNRLVNFDLSATRTWNSGSLPLAVGFNISGGVQAFASASTMTNGATFSLSNFSCGTNGTCTNESAIYLPTTVLTGSIANSYKLNIEADTGATSNYAERVIGQVVNGGTSPSISAGAGAGTSPTVSLSGPVAGGTVTITTGTSPTSSNATVATATYPVAFPTGSSVTLTPANAAAVALTSSTQVFAAGTTSGFTITSGSSALTGSTTYLFNYRVTGW